MKALRTFKGITYLLPGNLHRLLFFIRYGFVALWAYIPWLNHPHLPLHPLLTMIVAWHTAYSPLSIYRATIYFLHFKSLSKQRFQHFHKINRSFRSSKNSRIINKHFCLSAIERLTVSYHLQYIELTD